MILRRKLFIFTYAFSLLFCTVNSKGNDIKSHNNEYSKEDFINSNLKIYFLYVGEADCFILTYKEDKGDTKVFIIDAGENISLRRRKTDIVEKLKDIGVKEIEGFILTHPHHDHFWNMKYLFENFTEKSFGDKIKNFYYNTLYEDYESIKFEDYISSLKYESKVTTTLKNKYGENYSENDNFKKGKVHVGDNIYISEDNNLIIKVIGPVNKSEYFNDNSIVLLITYFNIKIILMADAGSDEEKDIIKYCNEKGIDISNIDMIKIGHHGYVSSSCREFTSVTKPKNVINSTGPHTLSWGLFNWHERPSIVKRWKESRKEEDNNIVKFYSTQEYGDITAFTKKEKENLYKICIKTGDEDLPHPKEN